VLYWYTGLCSAVLAYWAVLCFIRMIKSRWLVCGKCEMFSVSDNSLAQENIIGIDDIKICS
jgi:hypothetical protein